MKIVTTLLCFLAASANGQTPSGSSFPSLAPSFSPSVGAAVSAGFPSGSSLPSVEPSQMPSTSTIQGGLFVPSGSSLPSSLPSAVPSLGSDFLDGAAGLPSGSSTPSSTPSSSPSSNPSSVPSSEPSASGSSSDRGAAAASGPQSSGAVQRYGSLIVTLSGLASFFM